MKTKPIVWKSALSAILGLAVFLVVNILVTLALVLAAGLLLSIPVVGGILAWALTRGDGDPTIMVIVISVVASQSAAMKLVEKICKYDRTTGLAYKIFGIGLIAVQVYFLFCNLFLDGGGSIIANGVAIAAGCITFGSGKELMQPSFVDDEDEPEPEPERPRGPQDLVWRSVFDGMSYTKPTDRYIHIQDLQYAADRFGVDLDTALQLLNEDRKHCGMSPLELLKI